MDPDWVDVFPIEKGDIPAIAMLGTTRGYLNFTSNSNQNSLAILGIGFSEAILEKTNTISGDLVVCSVLPHLGGDFGQALVESLTQRIHGTGIFTYMNGWFLWGFSCR